ncbi:MAG: zinc-finger domain-containing protein [Pseudomonadota bacterium]
MNSSEQSAEVSVSKETVFRIRTDQLPLHCPLPEMSLWNQHPRVYLPIEDSGRVTCPYCSSVYILEE